VKVLIDMNLSPRWVDRLAAEGIEAEHWSAICPGTAPDAFIMAFAAANGHVVLTHDLDFGAILASTRESKPSVVLIRSDDLSPEVIGQRVVAALNQGSHELDQGALLVIDIHRTRLRLLPLRRDS